MALEILSFVKDIGELLWAPTGRQLGYLVHYSSNTESLQTQFEKLRAMKEDVQVSVNAANLNGETIKYEVQMWLRRVDAITIEVQRLDDEVKVNKICFSGWCPDWRTRYSLSKQAIKNRNAIIQLQADRKFDKVSHPAPPPGIEFMTSSGDFVWFESTRSAKDEVMEALKDDKVNVIGVYGMGGVGKTSLVKQVGIQAKKDGLFNQVVMAVVSQNPNTRKIQGQIADMLGVKLIEEEELGRASRLKERIMREKRILLILDDIWKTLELYQVGIPSGSELDDCKCKILLTTRRDHVCFVMGSQAKIQLKVLSEQDSWILFRKNAGREFPGDFHDVAWKVARECGGLPIAIIAVARAMGDKDRDEWNEAARRLEMSKPPNPDDEGDVFRSIKLSYDYLRGDDTKPFFLLCSLFPEDYDINTEDLVRYGMGVGLFQDVRTMEEARGSARMVTNHLKSSGLLLTSDLEGCIKMHDVIRDIAISIASPVNGHSFMVQAGFSLKEWPRKDTFESYTAISLMSNEICELPDGLEYPKLQILLLQNNNDLQVIPETFFEGLKALKVLDLSNTDISSLPSSIGLLTNLRTLCLDRCKSTDMSILGKLQKLEILSIRESCIEALPKEIGHLTNLRMLDFTFSNTIESIPPNVISSLSRLEELYMQSSFAEWWDDVEGDGEGTHASFAELTCLPCLTILKVDIKDAKSIPRNVSYASKWVKFDICISDTLFTWITNAHISKLKSAYTKTLVLDIPVNTLPDWFNKVVSERAEKLFYIECRGLSNILVECDQGRLNGLRSLIVQQCYGIYSLMNAEEWIPNRVVYESLEELRIHNMDYLSVICIGQLPNGCLGNLKFLEVQQCDEIVNALLTSNVLQRLQNLEILFVSGCSLKEVFRFDGLEEEQTLFRRLREIKLHNLPELTKIWNGPPRLAVFHNLKVIAVIKCKKLRCLFTPAISQGLFTLEDLWVEDCHGLEEIVGEAEGEEVMTNIIFPELKTLSLQLLPHITSFYSGSAPMECSSLEQLHVQDCPNFKTSTSDFHSRIGVQENNEQHLIILRKRLGELR